MAQSVETDPLDAVWHAAQGNSAGVDPLDAAWEKAHPTPGHSARVRAALGRVADAKAAQEGTTLTALRSFAGSVEDVGKTFLRGTGQIVGNLGDTVESPTLQRIGSAADRAAAAVGRHEAGVLPTPENVGRSPIASATAATVGEAAPQFVLGEAAGRAAAPLMRGVQKIVPLLRPSLGPAVTETPIVAGAKAFGRAILPQAVAQTATFAPLAKDQPVSPMGVAMSGIGALGEAAGAARVATKAKTMQAVADQNLIRDAVMQRAGIEQMRAENIKAIAGEEPTGPTKRIPASAVPQRLATAGLVSQDVAVPSGGLATREVTPTIGEPVSVASGPTLRRPGGAVDASKLAKPMAEGAPISTAETRAQLAALDEVLAANRVKAGEAAPATAEAFPEGYSTKSTATARRPAGAVPPEPAPVAPATPAVVTPELVPSEPPTGTLAPQQGPLRTRAQITAEEAGPVPKIGEPVSVGRDVAEPSRIPPNAPEVVQPRGVEPKGNVQTPEGAVSVGGSAKPITTEPTPAPEPITEKVEPPPSTPTTELAPVEGTGELRTRGLSAGVEEKAVAKKLTTSLGELPEFRTVNMADQAARATKLLADDPALARRVALGEAPPPADLLPESVFVALENKAIAEGDVGTLRALAQGELTGHATTMGQRIRALGERDPESPVAAIQKIVEARTKGAKNAKGATEASVAELQRHITEAVKMDPPAWKTFIDSIRC